MSTLIERTYYILKQAELTTTRQAFSRDYVGKNQNWFAYQTHMKRDFPLTAAIQCLHSLRLVRERDAAFDLVQLCALSEVEHLLLKHLNEEHWVAEVVA